MDHGGETLVSLAGPHGDSLELFEFLEEILNEMTPEVLLGVVAGRVTALRSGWNDRFGAALPQEVAEPIGIIGLVAEERVEGQAFDQGGDAGGFPALSWHKAEAHEVAETVDQRQNFRGQTAATLADRLISRPPFAP